MPSPPRTNAFPTSNPPRTKPDARQPLRRPPNPPRRRHAERCLLLSGTRTTFTHDPDGNQTREIKPSGDITTLVWDYENKNTAVLLPDLSRVTLTYNGDQRRVTKETDAATQKFVYDGENLLHGVVGQAFQPVRPKFLRFDRLIGSSELLPTHGQAEKPVLRTPRQYGLLVSQRQNDGGWQTLYPHFDAT